MALLSAGRLREVLSVVVEAEEAARHHLGDATPEYARIAHYLGYVHWKSGKYDDALVWYRKALSIREKTLGPAHPDVARTLSNIGNVHAGHPDLAKIVVILAGAYLRKGAYDDALAWYRRALASQEEVLGAEHPDLAYIMNGIAFALANKGTYDEALAWYRRALAAFEDPGVDASGHRDDPEEHATGQVVAVRPAAAC